MITWPANARGPVIGIALPAFATPLDAVITNATTGERMRLNLGVWGGADLVLDFYRRTVVDEFGNDRSALIDPSDHGMWHLDPLIPGVNDVQIEMQTGDGVLSAAFAGADAALDGQLLDTGQEWDTSGDGADFRTTGDGRCKRSVAGGAGRIAVAGSDSYAAVRVGGSVALTIASGINDLSGFFARRVNSTNNLVVGLVAVSDLRLKVLKNVAGSVAVMIDAGSGGPPVLGDPYRVVCDIDEDGLVTASLYHGAVTLVDGVQASSPSLATGGAIEAGAVGLFDFSTHPDSRYWDDFEARDITVDPSYPGATATVSYDIASYG